MKGFRTAGAIACLLGALTSGASAAPPEPQATPLAPLRTPTPGVLDADALKAGQYEWHPERSPRGPVVVVVSIPEQLAHVYRNGVEIGLTTVSTGRPGHATPTGVFTILQKQVKHESSIYQGAPMPYMERLTWDGIAMHAGNLPGYPASHGCVRMPLEFAHLLYGVTTHGGTVVIADEKSPQPEAAHPGALLAPGTQDPGNTAGFAWNPEKSPEGPISIVLSGRDRRLYVYRNGLSIGWADVQIVPPDTPFGSRVYTVLEGDSGEPNPWVPGQKLRRWQAVSLGGATSDPADLVDRLQVNPEFARDLYPLIVPGTTLFVTDAAAEPATRTAPGFTVLSGKPEPKAPPKNP